MFIIFFIDTNNMFSNFIEIVLGLFQEYWIWEQKIVYLDQYWILLKIKRIFIDNIHNWYSLILFIMNKDVPNVLYCLINTSKHRGPTIRYDPWSRYCFDLFAVFQDICLYWQLKTKFSRYSSTWNYPLLI